MAIGAHNQQFGIGIDGVPTQDLGDRISLSRQAINGHPDPVARQERRHIGVRFVAMKALALDRIDQQQPHLARRRQQVERLAPARVASIRASHATSTRSGARVGRAPAGTSSSGLPDQNSTPSIACCRSGLPSGSAGPTSVRSA
jgi:hypothetical protein